MIKPAYQIFIVDDKRRIWVKLSTIENASEAEWILLDQGSNVVGRAKLPDEVDLKVIRNDLAHGVFQERGGAPMVIVYQIIE